MRQARLGSAGPRVSRLGCGLWAVGGTHWGGADDDTSIAAIHAALELGATLFDTAPVYGFGHSESVLGRALAGRADEVVVATKCGLSWDDRGRIRHDNRPETVQREVRESLRRLRRDAIDLYQVHWPDPSVPEAETLGALEELRAQGLVRWIGVSNFDAARLREARLHAPVVSDQVPYNLLRRGIEDELLPACAELEVGVLAYEPLCRGLFTGTWDAERRPRKRDLRRRDPRFAAAERQARLALVDDLRPLAAEHGLTMAQLALAFAGSDERVTSVLVGIRTPAQARENLTVGELDEPSRAALRTRILESIRRRGLEGVDA